MNGRMPVFDATIRVAGQPGEGIPARFTLDARRVEIRSGEHLIGSWDVTELAAHMAEDGALTVEVEGDALLAKGRDMSALAAALAAVRPANGAAPPRRVERSADTTASNAITHLLARLRASFDELSKTAKLAVGGGLAGLLLMVLVPGIMGGLVAVAGGLVFAVGLLAWVDGRIALKLPTSLAPISLIVIGASLAVIGLLITTLD